MVDHALPAYLQNRAATPDFTDYAADGLGSALPPHVSIQGNLFTLIDSAGKEYQPLPVMDCVIVDRSNFACKMFFGKPWVPGSDEPPMCWSTNGIGPSKDAVSPQARTCAECANNVRGSAQSAISGASIKACRDEYHMAILLPAMPDMLFRYVLTPGSFKNWQAYVEKFKNSNVRISMVVTRMSFVPKVNGEVMFESTAYVDEVTNGRVQAALLEKKTDLLVGRLDTPKQAAIAASQRPDDMTGLITDMRGGYSQPTAQINPAPQVQQPAPFSPTGPSAQVAPTLLAASPTIQVGPAAVQTHVDAPTQRRRRRTQAEMAAAAPQANGAASASVQAPFPHPGRAAGQTPQQGSFGIAQGQPASGNPELSGMIDDFFKQG